MKRLLIICAALLAGFSALAQENAQQAAAEAAQAIAGTAKAEAVQVKPSYWNPSALLEFGINQTSLTNWAAGGYNTAAVNAGLDAQANYAKDLASWGNRLQLAYGAFWSADKTNLLQKSNDRIYFESKYGYKTSKDSKWSYSAAFDFRSQFTRSYDTYVTDDAGNWSGTLKSGFLSPAYTNLALGMDWNPNPWFNLNLSPLTGGFTIVQIPELRKKYGMELLEEGLDGSIGENYRDHRFQLGAQVKANAKAVINESCTLETQLVLFSDYLHKPQNLRINWDNKITWQLAKYFNMGISTWLIYDPNVLIAGADGISTQRVQFKEFIGFNFSYTIKRRDK